MSKLKMFLLLSASILMAISAYSQESNSEFIYWRDTSSGLVNHRIISMLESADHELYLLDKATDANYENPSANFTRMNLKGKILNSGNIIGQDVYDLIDIVILPDNKIRINGTIYSSGRFNPYFETLTKAGKVDPYIFSYNLVPILAGNSFKTKDNFYIETITTQNPQGGADDSDPNQPGSLWNVWVYKKALGAENVNEQATWHRKLLSEFHEEPIKTVSLAAGGFISLVKRYTDPEFTTYCPVMYALSANGEILWSKELNYASSYTSASIVSDSKSQIYVLVGNGNERAMLSKTSVFQFSAKGDSVASTNLDNICSNGGLINQENQLLLFGKVYKAEMNYIISRATTCLLDNSLKVLNVNSTDMFDPPDYEIPGLGISVFPTSSDFLSGLVLSDGRIAFGGRVYMPENIKLTAMELMYAKRFNFNLIVFAKQNGDFGTYKE